jgi:hypothetical protein
MSPAGANGKPLSQSDDIGKFAFFCTISSYGLLIVKHRGKMLINGFQRLETGEEREKNSSPGYHSKKPQILVASC